MEIPKGLNGSVVLFWGPRGRGFNSAPSRAQTGQGNPAPQEQPWISAQGGDRRLSCILGINHTWFLLWFVPRGISVQVWATTGLGAVLRLGT